VVRRHVVPRSTVAARGGGIFESLPDRFLDWRERDELPEVVHAAVSALKVRCSVAHRGTSSKASVGATPRGAEQDEQDREDRHGGNARGEQNGLSDSMNLRGRVEE